MPVLSAHHLLLPELPPQVKDLDEWGRTVICFGHYKDMNMSYKELAMSEDPRARSYIKWCTARIRSATGLLGDLASFLSRFEAERDFRSDEAWEGATITGTSVRRTLK